MDDVGQTLLNWASAFGTQEMVRSFFFFFSNIWNFEAVFFSLQQHEQTNLRLMTKGYMLNLGLHFSNILQYGNVEETRLKWQDCNSGSRAISRSVTNAMHNEH